MLLNDAAATEAAGARLAAQLAAGDVVALSGPLGTGKTCFARGILRGLGFIGDVPSPTFGIINPYGPPDVAFPVWHIDLYRLDGPAEIDELGLDDARGDAALLIEWPERLGNWLWPDALCIQLNVAQSGRRLTATVPPSWSSRWPFQ